LTIPHTRARLVRRLNGKLGKNIEQFSLAFIAILGCEGKPILCSVSN
jgi:hypothetical protein